jgi:F0F1-type ATP synthase assembly protein I
VGVFTALGWWLDRRFGTAPWLMVTGGGIGLVGGLYNLWKQSKRYL